MYKNYLKRLIDFLLSTIAFILALPIFVLVTILLMIANKGKAFFFQARPGKDEKVFKVIKFKTMTDERGVDGELLSDADRLTTIGSFVRKTSLDEIPQLLNVIKGDMSLIGPRPLAIQYLSLYSEKQRRRHSVKPGISGWAQVNGRNNISWKRKFELDIWYIDHLSFLLDLKIVFLTIYKVIKRDGVHAEGQETVESFNGNN